MKNDLTWVNGIFKLHIPDMSEYTPVVSYSQYSKYKTCPRSWYIRYVQKIKDDEPSVILTYGNAMHALVQYWLKLLFTKGEKFTKELNWADIFKNILKQEYLKDFDKHKTHFSTPEELMTYFSDGYEVFSYLMKNRSKYFSLRDMQLIGIELPIYLTLDPNNDKVKFSGFLDLVLYDKSDKTYIVIDLKTSKRGWSKWDKENKLKMNQVVAYKKYFSTQYNIPESAVSVKFMILRQSIDPDSLWPKKRVQEIAPTSGSRTVKLVDQDVKTFISKCFVNNQHNQTRDEFSPNPGRNEWNCKFCPYKDMHELCDPKDRIPCESV
jgi:hypothetical protein